MKTGGWAVVPVQNQQVEAYSVRMVTQNMNTRGDMENQTLTHQACISNDNNDNV